MSETNDWLFFLDESGQEQKESPQIVFGGFGIDASKFESFKSDIEAAYFDAFGYPLSEKSEELKGKFLLKKKEFKEAGLIPALSDGERKELIAQLRTKNGNSGFSFKMRPAKGQASLLFVESVFKLLKKHECYVVASVIAIDNFKEINGSISTADLTAVLEAFVYREIFDFSKFKKISKVDLLIDNSSMKQDRNRKNNFNDELNYYSSVKDIVYETYFINSDHNIGISVADIIIYCLNFGMIHTYFINNSKINNLSSYLLTRDEINDLICKYLQPIRYENDFIHPFGKTLSHRITQILKKP